jgi:hypothetical protein
VLRNKYLSGTRNNLVVTRREIRTVLGFTTLTSLAAPKD